VILTPIVAYLAFAILLSFAFRECIPSRTSDGVSKEFTTTLEAASPGFEQRVTVHVPAAGLPDQTRANAVTLNLDRVARPPVAPRSSSGTSPPPAASASAEVGSDVRIAFIREDTGDVVTRVTPPAFTADFSGRAALAAIPLDCVAGLDCDRIFRVVVSLPDGATERGDSISRAMRATINWGFTDCAGPPYLGRPVVTVEPPLALGSDRIVSAGLPIRSAHATIVARHITVSTASAPEAAYGHLFVRRRNPATPWVPWLRIVADEGAPNVVDLPLAEPYGGANEHVVDFPILADCVPRVPCTRGYWVLIQAMPSLTYGGDLAWHAEPDVGSIDWELGVVAVRAAGDGASAELAFSVDREPADLAQAPIIATDTVVMGIDPAVERIQDVTLHVPAFSRPDAGPDPLRAAYVVVNATGFGVAHGYHLEGDGAGPFRGGASGDSATALIAHPFDQCPATGLCDVVIRMVGVLTPNPNSSMRGTPNVTWRLTLPGVPAGTTATVGPVQERRRTDGGGGGVPPPILLLAGAAAMALVLVVVRRFGRRTRRRPAAP
jgi:hypothetical protein